MKNELLKIGPFTVYGYGLMIAIGILLAYFTGERRAKKRGLPYEHVFNLVICCVPGGFVGAKFLYWITEWKSIAADPSFMRYTLTDGFVVFGGIIGGIGTAILYCRAKGLKFLPFFDTLMPSVALAQGFGRIGCFLAGCCYGKETGSPLSVTFTDSSFAPNGVALVPTQIYSSILDFLNYFILLIILKNQKKRRRDSCGLPDFLQCRQIRAGVLPGRSGKRKCGSVVYLSVYFYFYLCSRNIYAGIFYPKRTKVG